MMSFWNWFTGLFIGKPKISKTSSPEIKKQFAGKTTITFVINSEMLDRLKRQGSHLTNQDLINSALTMYKWALNSLEEGRIIASVNERDESYHVLSTPAFDKLKKQIPWGTWTDEDTK